MPPGDFVFRQYLNANFSNTIQEPFNRHLYEVTPRTNAPGSPLPGIDTLKTMITDALTTVTEEACKNT